MSCAARTRVSLSLPDMPPPTPIHPQVKQGKSAKFKLGVYDPKLGSAIQEATSFPCVANDMVGEVLRGIRAGFARFLDGLSDTDLRKAQLGLAHSYSRAKVGYGRRQLQRRLLLQGGAVTAGSLQADLSRHRSPRRDETLCGGMAMLQLPEHLGDCNFIKLHVYRYFLGRDSVPCSACSSPIINPTPLNPVPCLSPHR